MSVNTVECKVSWVGGPGQGYFFNILHLFYAAIADVDQAFADTVAGDLGSAFSSTDWHLAINDDVTLASITVRDLRAPDLPAFDANVGIPGSSNADPLPAQIALVTTLRTTVGSRRGRGRIYGSGYTEAQNDSSGNVAPAVALAVSDGWNTFNAAIQGDDVGALGVFSKADDETREVVSLSTDTTWDSQRRRVR
jgi:hypothetical protein